MDLLYRISYFAPPNAAHCTVPPGRMPPSRRHWIYRILQVVFAVGKPDYTIGTSNEIIKGKLAMN